jgi:hypothetical protein
MSFLYYSVPIGDVWWWYLGSSWIKGLSSTVIGEKGAKNGLETTLFSP